MGILATFVVVLHLAFIIFVAAGALLILKWPRMIWVHLPAIVWGMYVEFTSGTCPLTALEKYFRERAGQEGYSTDFIDHYLLPIVYPRGLTPDQQWILGAIIFVLNAVLYYLVWLRRRTPATRVVQSTS